jgi:hypothetical protein
MLIAPLSAHAAGVTVVGVSSSGGDTSLLRQGDVLTIDVVADNVTNLDIFGLGLDIRGYDTDANGIADNGLALLGGSLAGSLYNDQTFPGPVSAGGIDNIHSSPLQKGNPADPFGGIDAVELHAVVFEGAKLTPSNGDGSIDVGVDGDLIQNGDVHFRGQFIATAHGMVPPTAITLDIGTHAEFGNVAIGAGGSTLPFVNDQVYFSVVPEPGTALLFGLGLAGLATTRRR